MDKILIIDFGSQYTQLIARRVRELRVFSEIVSASWLFNNVKGKIQQDSIKGVILSGGPGSVSGSVYSERDASLRKRLAYVVGCVPILGVCFGYQLLIKLFGGSIKKGNVREYGLAYIEVDEPQALFGSFSAGDLIKVWMSHGDIIETVPESFDVYAHSEFVKYAASGNEVLKVYGVQFHPEVWHTKDDNKIIDQFVLQICKTAQAWQSDGIVNDLLSQIEKQVGDSDIICALSGGVDSLVMAVLLHKVVGSKLKCFTIDTGLLREGEPLSTLSIIKPLGLNIKVVDGRERFFTALKGIVDPEEKRKYIGEVFIQILIHEAKEIGSPEFLAQGTLYPDVIESKSVVGPSQKIKSHHNVGGLPEDLPFELVEPFKKLFKDEVRAIGRYLGLDDVLILKEPFPGPGFAVRIIGVVTRKRVDILRKTDSIIMEEVAKVGLDKKLWQSFAVLLPVNSVGIKGDKRSYEEVIAIRSVESLDGMTANWSRLPYELLDILARRIVNEIDGINRVVYDITSKPPATIEWE